MREDFTQASKSVNQNHVRENLLYARNGKHDVTATYVNRVDLNLTRMHHSISYGSNAVAAYVCNFLGPAADTQVEVDKAITNAVNGRNLVACVAMDIQ